MKIDPYHHRRRYRAWQERTKNGIPGLSPANSTIVQQYLRDMELGVNIARGTRKGGRSFIRLHVLSLRLVSLARRLEERFRCALPDLTEEQVHAFFTGMRNGAVRKQNGGIYRSTGDYVKDFKSFWHWHMKVQRKCGLLVPDICTDLDTSREKPPWVYLTEDDVRRLCDHATYKYRVLMLFMFDSGIRSPTELVNVRVSDLRDECRQLCIRAETSKTFGRTINLLLCPEVVRRYIADRRLQPDAQLFPLSPGVVNRYLRRLARRVLGDGMSCGGSLYARLTMYDFRHASACYWVPRYKSETALKYRFGWRKSRMIAYYTDFLGMRDTIQGDDVLLGAEKTVVEQELAAAEQEKQRLGEELAATRREMKEILDMVTHLSNRVEVQSAPDR